MVSMEFYSKAAMERAMKVQEVILRALAKKITWWQAAEIIGISDRHMRRWRERYEEFGYDGLFDRLLPRRQGRKLGSHALLEGQARMISLQIQEVAGTGEKPSLAALHRKIAAACRKRRLPIPSYGTVLRRLRAYDALTSRRKLERPARSQSTVRRKKRSTH